MYNIRFCIRNYSNNFILKSTNGEILWVFDDKPKDKLKLHRHCNDDNHLTHLRFDSKNDYERLILIGGNYA